MREEVGCNPGRDVTRNGTTESRPRFFKYLGLLAGCTCSGKCPCGGFLGIQVGQEHPAYGCLSELSPEVRMVKKLPCIQDRRVFVPHCRTKQAGSKTRQCVFDWLCVCRSLHHSLACMVEKARGFPGGVPHLKLAHEKRVRCRNVN